MNKKTVFIVLGIVILVALVAIGIILRKPTTAPGGEESTPAQTETETSTQPCETCTGGAAEAPTGTPAELPAETPSAEIPEFSSCILLDEEYCNKGEPLYYQGSLFPELRGKLLIVGFTLPEGTKVYAPADGFYSEGGWGNVEQTLVILPPFENGLIFQFAGVTPRPELRKALTQAPYGVCEKGFSTDPEKYYCLYFPSEETTGAMPKLKKGELIGTVSGKLIDTGDAYAENKKYTMVIIVNKGNYASIQESEELTDRALIDVLSPYFPYLK